MAYFLFMRVPDVPDLEDGAAEDRYAPPSASPKGD
jgi:hypothetical protein